MKATGIIVEYNPFHNGHLLHLREAKKQTHADVIIAVMSGSFFAARRTGSPTKMGTRADGD